MNVVCKYSGLCFRAEGFGRTEVAGIHPIFFTPTPKLEIFFSDWAQGKLSTEESRLLFLALLNSTSLVDWSRGVPATPPEGVVQRYMEKIFQFSSWINNWQSPALKFPCYFIGAENSKLQNIKIILEIWQKVYDDFYETNARKRIHTKKLEELEVVSEKLQILLNSSPLDTRRGRGNRRLYAKRLSDWAMVAGDVPKDIREFWESLFLLEGMDLYNARTVDLEELLEHFEDALDFYSGGIFAKSTISFLRKLLDEHKKGILFALGEDDDVEDFAKYDEKPFDFLEDEEEAFGSEEEEGAASDPLFSHPIFRSKAKTLAAETLARVAASAPLERPLRENFPDLMSFLKAKAAYNISKRNI